MYLRPLPHGQTLFLETLTGPTLIAAPDAVVDWTQASYGPPALDVGHMRWNLAADHGRTVADRFLDCYRATIGRRLDHQAYWDLVSLLDLLLAGEDPEAPRG